MFLRAMLERQNSYDGEEYRRRGSSLLCLPARKVDSAGVTPPLLLPVASEGTPRSCERPAEDTGEG